MPNWIYGPADVRAIKGAANGLTVPGVMLLLALPTPSQAAAEASQKGLLRLAEALGLQLGEESKASTTGPELCDTQLRQWSALMASALTQLDPILSRKVAGSSRWQRRAGLFEHQGQPVEGYVVLWPTHWPDAVAQVLSWSLTSWLRLAQEASDEQVSQDVAGARARWLQNGVALKQALPPGVNASNLLAAARALKRPAFWLDHDLLQIGHGRRARWLRSTTTDATSLLGASLAKDKVRTNRLLRQAGIPVPKHEEVKQAEAAVAAAERLGWPVVIKPADKDRGEGARANLQTSGQVAAAFQQASAISKRVLVEQCVMGHEFRLTVVNGRLLWAHERVPATVVGDGRHTLQELIEMENAKRRQALLTNPAGLTLIQMDASNVAYLQETGWGLQDTPAAGDVVRLQRVPAATTGGGGRGHFHEIHPDNRLVAERAAQLLRLDIAGVDLIMPDITRSWREVGGAVTEVNAIPQISILTDQTLVQRLLQQLMPHSGRVPLLYVLGEGEPPAWMPGLLRRFADVGLRVGLTTNDGLQIGEDWIRGPRTSLWDDVRALQVDPTVGAIAVVSDGKGLLETGLPFDTIDALVVQAYRSSVLSLLLPYARGFRAVVGEALLLRYGAELQGQIRDWRIWNDPPLSVDRLAGELFDALLGAEAAYAETAD